MSEPGHAACVGNSVELLPDDNCGAERSPSGSPRGPWAPSPPAAAPGGALSLPMCRPPRAGCSPLTAVTPQPRALALPSLLPCVLPQQGFWVPEAGRALSLLTAPSVPGAGLDPHAPASLTVGRAQAWRPRGGRRPLGGRAGSLPPGPGRPGSCRCPRGKGTGCPTLCLCQRVGGGQSGSELPQPCRPWGQPLEGGNGGGGCHSPRAPPASGPRGPASPSRGGSWQPLLAPCTSWAVMPGVASP